MILLHYYYTLLYINIEYWGTLFCERNYYVCKVSCYSHCTFNLWSIFQFGSRFKLFNSGCLPEKPFCKGYWAPPILILLDEISIASWRLMSPDTDKFKRTLFTKFGRCYYYMLIKIIGVKFRYRQNDIQSEQLSCAN